MAVFFWYLVKSYLSSVRYRTRLHWTSNFLQGTRDTRPCLIGHSVDPESCYPIHIMANIAIRFVFTGLSKAYTQISFGDRQAVLALILTELEGSENDIDFGLTKNKIKETQISFIYFC